MSRISVLRILRGQESIDLGSFSPNELRLIDVLILFFIFIFRALAMQLGFSQNLTKKFRDQEQKVAKASDTAVNLPNTSLVTALRIEERDLKRYGRAVFQKPIAKMGVPTMIGDSPAHLCLFLSALSEPAILMLLAHSQSPINPLGAVNVSNTFHLYNVRLARQFLIESISKPEPERSLRAKVYTSFSKQARLVKRGAEVDIILQINVAETQNATSETELFRWTFRILEFGRTTSTQSQAILSEVKPSVEPMVDKTRSEAKAQIHLKNTAPTRWARLCRDYNPIHMSRLMARLYGFKGKIAHGNHVAALAMREISKLDISEAEALSDKSFTFEVRFKRPMVLPCTLDIRPAITPGLASSDWEVTLTDKKSGDGKVMTEISYNREK